MPVRITPFNTYLTDIKPENAAQEAISGRIKKERRKLVYDRRQRETDRRKPNAESHRTDEKSLAPILQELRNSFSFLNENEQADGTGTPTAGGAGTA
jgi:hypothetical protein